VWRPEVACKGYRDLALKKGIKTALEALKPALKPVCQPVTVLGGSRLEYGRFRVPCTVYEPLEDY
jgi:hypothetical protein